jgi:hypothetical protein
MSDMKKLLESMTKFSFANPKQKPGDQWRGTDKAPPGNKLVGGAAESKQKDDELDELTESLMTEYKNFVPEVGNAVKDDNATSPVAKINPPSRSQQRVVDEADPNPAPGTQAPAPGTQAPAPGTTPPAQGTTTPPAQGTTPPKPGQPPAAPGTTAPAGQATTPPGQTPKPGQPATPPAAPTNPAQVTAMTQLKQATGNAKIVPNKAAAAAAVAQSNPQALNPDQKAQLQQIGQAVAPAIDNPQDIAKIKSILPTATNPAAQPPK